ISLMADKERKLIRSPFVLTRGFVYVKSNQELLQFIADSTEKIYTNAVKENSDNNTVKDKITTEIGKLVYKETEREPIIMTILNYV
ncbi:partial Ribonuclease J2, partial [Patescibacteria group bacterium]